MDIDSTCVIENFSGEEELARMLPLIKDIAIIEYDGKNIDGSCAIEKYLKENEIDTAVVNRIVLLGKRTSKTNANANVLSELYPSAEITIANKLWDEVNPRKLKICNTLVFHIGTAVDISDDLFDQEINNGEIFVDFVNSTRVSYFVCLLKSRQKSPADNPLSLRSNLRLREFAFEPSATTRPKAIFCQEKQEYINSCLKNLTAKDAFFQCVDESEHGCEECNQCGKYGSHKKCPFAQRTVAKFYRDGIYVPQNDRIAHQWEVMASRQDYKPACIQVADDLKEGCGCNKDTEAALEIYSSYASQLGNEHCINQILDIAEKDSEINRAIALPFIAQQAQDGNEDMIIKISDAFQNEEYGLPKDIVQQKEWIQQGAENGNPRFVLAMAEMYESNSDWKEAYKWYKTLVEVTPLSYDDKLEEVELKMLTNGVSIHEVAVSGQNYLFGYFRFERDLHLAYRCLKYASDNGDASAKGLLGLMFLNGWDVETNFDRAINLLTEAAEYDDLFSMHKLLTLYYSDYNNYNEGYKWANVIVEKIEEGINNDEPFAYYLKGHYCSIGYKYDTDGNEAFINIKKAAELNIPIAQFELSEMYAEYTSTHYDIQESNRWLKTSADNGYYKAEGKYGIKMYKNAIWTYNKREAFPYLKHAYDQGYTDAYWPLARCYMYGYGTAVNKEMAYPLYTKAAEAGILDAQKFLCEKYFHGDAPLPKDYKLCAKWGEEAIKQGCKSIRFETAYSQSNTGNSARAKELYLELANEGDGAAMNNYACELSDAKEKAMWFQKSADKGDDYGMWNIAKQYKNGAGVEKDIDKAIYWFAKSADEGHTGAMKDLARMYRYGDGVDKDGESALIWYKKAADKDDLDAILAIAEIYNDGGLVPRNIEQSIHYYKIAAEKGNATALFKLGETYEYGVGVEPNINKAIYWYRKAAVKGNYNAQNSLKRLNSNWMDSEGNVIKLDDNNDDNFD